MATESDRDLDVAASGRDLPPEFLAIVSKALHTVRDLRYPSGAELCTALKEVQRTPRPLTPARPMRSSQSTSGAVPHGSRPEG